MKDIVKLNKLIEAMEEYDSVYETTESSMLKRLKDLAETHYIKDLKKRAEGIEVSEPKKVNMPIKPLTELLACLKLNLNYMQAAHWIAKGDSSYGDHLLFERIYDELGDEMDAYAEKVLALSSDQVVNPIEVLNIAAERMPKVITFDGNHDGNDLAKYAVNSEKYVLAELEKLYDLLKEQDNMTMGLDDLLMEMHSNHENHVYLLRQRIKT